MLWRVFFHGRFVGSSGHDFGPVFQPEDAVVGTVGGAMAWFWEGKIYRSWDSLLIHSISLQPY